MRISSLACWSVIVASTCLPGSSAIAQERPLKLPQVSSRVHEALAAYLDAAPDRQEENRLLKRALQSLKGDLALATAALRTLPPLTEAKAGTHHGRVFRSGGHEWEYSIHLPDGYAGDDRYPVIVLPDHGTVSPEAALEFWTGAAAAAGYIFFRPVIVKHAEDPERFPDRQFFARDQAIASVFRDALTHLRLHYAVDHDRISMTGLSQAGYYTWYFAVSFPDEFAAVVPESAGGLAVRAAVLPLAANLTSLKTRILHARGDQVTPYEDASRMAKAIEAAGGPVKLISYGAADYRRPNPRQHPGPHHLRLEHVLTWAKKQRRRLPDSFRRVLRYSQQGHEGSFRVEPPESFRSAFELECSRTAGKVSTNRTGVELLVPPEDFLLRRRLVNAGSVLRARPDLALMLREFKRRGDPRRLVAARIELQP